MNFTQTHSFKMDVDHYTNIAKEWMYTTRKEEIQNTIFRVEKYRGRDYAKKLAAKCNQKLKVKFYSV